MDNDKCYVYRYVDLNDGLTKYVGIVTGGTLANRNRAHMRDEWYKNGEFAFEYIEVPNKSTAEAIESHLISLYHTDLYYNKAKAGWGTIEYFPESFEWKSVTYETDEILEKMRFSLDFALEKGNKNISISLIGDYLKKINHYKKVKEFASKKISIYSDFSAKADNRKGGRYR